MIMNIKVMTMTRLTKMMTKKGWSFDDRLK